MDMPRALRALTAAAVVVAVAWVSSASAQSANACWGQASAAFAQMGAMGEHASEFPTPRLGLRNLARALYEAGVIGDDSMQALGRFVVSELGLEVDACR
jgi:hypothetical protein